MTDIFARQRTIVGTTIEWAANDLIIGDGEIAVEVASADMNGVTGIDSRSLLPEFRS